MEKALISIVIPMYNEEGTFAELYKALNRTSAAMKEYDFEYLFVNDGSQDMTLAMMRALAERDTRVRYVSFTRNFGKEAALYAGLRNARGDYVATMDADLQDPPSLLPKMMELLKDGKYDNVACRRISRYGEPPIRSFCARTYYRMLRRLAEIQIVDGARDYRLMRREMVDSILSLCEYNRFSKGIFAWVGYDTRWLEYENVERAAGETKWSFWGLFRYSLDGIFNFSSTPLRLSSYLGIGLTALSFLAIVFEVFRALIFGDPVAGWPSLVCIVTFIGGIQLFCMGIMGQYLARTYTEVKRRPHYIVKESNCEGERKKEKEMKS